MNENPNQPSAPTSGSHDCVPERTEPVSSEATRHSHGLCPGCDGAGIIVINPWRNVVCYKCMGTGRANDQALPQGGANKGNDEH